MADEFDPTEHTVAEVNEYLSGVTDPDEIARVRALEEAGSNRSSIVWPDLSDDPDEEPAPEPDPVPEPEPEPDPEPEPEPEPEPDPEPEPEEPDDPDDDWTPRQWFTETHGRPVKAHRSKYEIVRR